MSVSGERVAERGKSGMKSQGKEMGRSRSGDWRRN
jgi:hypothetical protein